MNLIIDLWTVGLIPAGLGLILAYIYTVAKKNNQDDLAKLASIAKGAVEWAEKHFATGEMKKAQALNRINKAIEHSDIAKVVTSDEVNRAIEDAVKELRKGANSGKN